MFRKKEAWRLLIVFFAIAIFCLVLFNLLSLLFLSPADQLALRKANGSPLPAALLAKLKWIQIVSSIGMFLLPAIAVAKLLKKNIFSFLGLATKPRQGGIALCICIWVVSLPLMGYAATLVKHISFGRWQSFIDSLDEHRETLIHSFAHVNHPVDVLVNLLMIAAIPALVEEFFFRAALLPLLSNLLKRPQAAVLVGAAIFSVIHFSMSSLLPIFILGVVLGWVYTITKNIWYCVIIHFVNNALALAALMFSNRYSWAQQVTAADHSYIPWYLVLGCVLCLLYFINQLSQNYRAAEKEATAID